MCVCVCVRERVRESVCERTSVCERKSVRERVYVQVVTQKKFDIMIAVFIVSNVCTMSAESFQVPQSTRPYVFIYV